MGNKADPKYTTPDGQLSIIRMVSRSALTVSDQYMGERPVLSAPPVDLYRPHECHHDHNEIEYHDTAPGHCQTLGGLVSTKNEG